MAVLDFAAIRDMYVRRDRLGAVPLRGRCAGWDRKWHTWVCDWKLAGEAETRACGSHCNKCCIVRATYVSHPTKQKQESTDLKIGHYKERFYPS
jgi:hypothetical protein